jgi:hypothetical protein
MLLGDDGSSPSIARIWNCVKLRSPLTRSCRSTPCCTSALTSRSAKYTPNSDGIGGVGASDMTAFYWNGSNWK